MGCAHTQSQSVASEDGRARINLRASERPAVIAIEGQRRQTVEALHVAADLTTWLDPETGGLRSAPTSEVEAVTFRRPGYGALEGLAVGALVGAALGFVAYEIERGDPATAFAGQGEVTGTIGLVGGLAGAAVGAALSDRVVYRAVAPGDAEGLPRSVVVLPEAGR